MSLTPACGTCGNLNPQGAIQCLRCGGPLLAAPAMRPPAHVPDSSGAPSPQIGEILAGRYCIEERLGEGAAGVVFRATDRHHGRTVALKILSATSAHHARRAREPEVQARVCSPHVVTLHEAFEWRGHLVLDLEYVAGGSLAARLERGALPLEQALGLARDLLLGLDALHREGLIHRDLKPANVLLAPEGGGKIADLGIAHDTLGQRITRTHAVLGTSQYMAPEQVQGAGVDARTDIYAWGLVVYEMLAGRAAFGGESDFEVQEAQVRASADLGALARGVPLPILRVLGRALEKDPARRWPGAAEALAALTKAVTQVPALPSPTAPREVSSRPWGAGGAARTRAAPRTTVWGTVAVLGVLGALAVAGGTVSLVAYFLWRAAAAPPERPRAQGPAALPPEPPPATAKRRRSSAGSPPRDSPAPAPICDSCGYEGTFCDAERVCRLTPGARWTLEPWQLAVAAGHETRAGLGPVRLCARRTGTSSWRCAIATRPSSSAKFEFQNPPKIEFSTEELLGDGVDVDVREQTLETYEWRGLRHDHIVAGQRLFNGGLKFGLSAESYPHVLFRLKPAVGPP